MLAATAEGFEEEVIVQDDNSFFESLHEDFLISKSSGCDVRQSSSLSYSASQQVAISSSARRAHRPEGQFSGEMESAVNALSCAVFEGQIEFDRNWETMIDLWNGLIERKLIAYKQEFARIIQESAAERCFLEDKARYYQEQLESHLQKCNREEVQAEITAKKKDQLFDNMELTQSMSEVALVVEKMLNCVESASLRTETAEMLAQLEERSFQLEEANSQLEESHTRVTQAQFDVHQQATEIARLKVEIEKLASSHELQIANFNKAHKLEIEQNSDTILKLKRVIARERSLNFQQQQNQQFKVQQRDDTHQESQQYYKQQQLEGDVMPELNSHHLMKSHSQVKGGKRKNKSLDAQQGGQTNTMLTLNRLVGGGNSCGGGNGSITHSRSVCVDEEASLNENSEVVKQPVKQRRTVSLMNGSSSVVLCSSSSSSAEKSALLIQRREKMIQRNKLKAEVKKFYTEFEEINKRAVGCRTDQKPILHLFDVLKRLGSEIDSINIQVEALSTQQQQQQLQQQPAAAEQSELQDQRFVKENNKKQASHHNHTSNANVSLLEGSSRQLLMVEEDNLSIIDCSTSTIARQTIFKPAANASMTRHLQLNNNSFSQTNNNNCNGNNCNNNNNISSSNNNNDSTIATTILIDHGATSNTILEHTRMTGNNSQVNGIVPGLRLEINNLTQANNLLRESLLASKSLEQHEKEMSVRDHRIVNLEGCLERVKREMDERIREMQSQQQSEFQEVKRMNEIRISELESELNVLAEKFRNETKERRTLHNLVEDMKGKVRVFCRIRPLSQQEITTNPKIVVDQQDQMTLTIATNRLGIKNFTFDACLGNSSSQEEVFSESRRLIQSAVDGYNVCIFAYGQTGSGKTYTMIGTGEDPGIAPRSVEEIFDLLRPIEKTCRVSVSATLVELYLDNLVDLLASESAAGAAKKLEVKEDLITNSTYISNATTIGVSSCSELMDVIRQGMANRKVSRTEMNLESSRSHLVVSIMLSIYNPLNQTTRCGKVNLIDLAGSERVVKSNANPLQCKEAQSINKSLTALGDVIQALTSSSNGKDTAEKFVPYRNSKLTYLMKDSLGGNAKTLMIVNVSPSEYNCEESLSSLIYANRVKFISNDATKNVETREYTRLKERLSIALQENELLQQRRIDESIVGLHDQQTIPAPLLACISSNEQTTQQGCSKQGQQILQTRQHSGTTVIAAASGLPLKGNALVQGCSASRMRSSTLQTPLVLPQSTRGFPAKIIRPQIVVGENAPLAAAVAAFPAIASSAGNKHSSSSTTTRFLLKNNTPTIINNRSQSFDASVR